MKGELKQMCNSCGEVFPMDWTCAMRNEGNGEWSTYHLYCKPPEKKCEDCGLHRNVCDECRELPDEEA
ncbi:hypothetical protein skT53_14550 [Effusibacillus dendaii]|uniref:Uncharacterized protein n=1 Tax=Effusibacillus dendaii TaxID=2743772 RepID=A0A7I8DD68_9BACL|nr:hypothetical protein skT53_14550 [Effusibacillus dendaii]